MLIDNFIDYLEELFPATTFFNGTINRSVRKCVGIYLREGTPPHMALGGPTQSSFITKPISMLVHWTEDANLCEATSALIYNSLFGKSNFMIGDIRISAIEMLDGGPIGISRDSNNICEMVIRCNIIYDREVI